MMIPRRILVTGVEGFVGGYLADRLSADGHLVEAVGFVHRSVGAVDNPRYAGYRVIDVRDYRAVELALNLARPDVVIHMAAISQVKDAELVPYQACTVNTLGTLNVLEAARQMKWDTPLIITASSDKVYGFGTSLYEDMVLKPVHPYDASKAAGDLLAQSYGKFWKLPIVITRCANLYGPGDCNWQRLIPGVLRDIIEGRDPYIRSNGMPVREYLYIGDFYDAVVKIIERYFDEAGEEQPWARGETYNLSGQRKMVVDVLDDIRRITQLLDVTMNFTGESTTESDFIGLVGDKFAERFGWFWTTPLEEGLVPTVSWLADVLEAGKWKREWMQRTSTPK